MKKRFTEFKNIVSEDRTKEILSKGGISFIYRVLSLILSYVFFIFIEKNYSEGSVGLFQLSNSIIIVISLLVSFGFQTSVVRFVSTLIEKQKFWECYKVVLGFIRIILPLSILVGAIVFIFSDQIGGVLFENKGMEQSLRIIGIFIPFYTFYWIFVELYRGFSNFRRSELYKYVALWGSALMICFFVSLYSDLNFWPFLSFCLAVVLTLIFMLPGVISLLKGLLADVKGKVSEVFKISDYIKSSYPMIVTSLAFIFLIRVDYIMLGSFANISISEVGVYGIAVKLSVLANFSNLALQRMAAPKISTLFWSNQLVELKSVIRRVKQLNLVFSVIACTILLFFAEELLAIFGQEYVSGALVLRIVTIAYFINSYFGLAGVFMNMTGNERPFMVIMFFSIILNIILNYVLIPQLGILGPALSTLLCFFLWNIITTIYLYRKYKIKMYYLPFIDLRK